MVRSFITSSSLALFWMFSPNAIESLGEITGKGEQMFSEPVTIGFLISVQAVLLIYHPSVFSCQSNSLATPSNETEDLIATVLISPSIGQPLQVQRFLPVLLGALLFWLLAVGMHCFAKTRKLEKLNENSHSYLYRLSAVFPLFAILRVCIARHTATLVVFCVTCFEQRSSLCSLNHADRK